jgi:hypothetical protein
MTTLTGTLNSKMTYKGKVNEIVKMVVPSIPPATKVIAFNYFSSLRVNILAYIDNVNLLSAIGVTGGTIGLIDGAPVASNILYIPCPAVIHTLSIYIKLLSAGNVAFSVAMLPENIYSVQPVITDPIQEIQFISTQDDGSILWMSHI